MSEFAKPELIPGLIEKVKELIEKHFDSNPEEIIDDLMNEIGDIIDEIEGK